MFDKLSGSTKQKILNGMMLVGIGLFVAALLFGQSHPDNAEKAGVQSGKETEQAAQSVDGSLSGSTPNQDQTSVSQGEDQEGPDISSESSAQDLPEPTIDDSKRVAVQFAKTFNTYDSKHYLKHLTDAKKYMSSSLYQQVYQTYPSESGTNIRKKVFKKAKVFKPEPSDSTDSPTKVIWHIEIDGQQTDMDGKKEKTVDSYLIFMQKVKGQYKVDNFRVNEPIDFEGNIGNQGGNQK